MDGLLNGNVEVNVTIDDITIIKIVVAVIFMAFAIFLIKKVL